MYVCTYDVSYIEIYIVQMVKPKKKEEDKIKALM